MKVLYKNLVKLLALTLFFQVSESRCAYAQEEFIEPPSKLVTKVKFHQYIGGVVMVKAQLENYPDSLNFILDTGSGGISLDSTTALELGMQLPPQERLIRGIGGTRKVGFLKNLSLKIGGILVDSLNFHVVDYEMLSALYGERIDGIIGYAFLSRYIVRLNYDDLEMSLWSLGSMKYPRGGYLFTPRINMLPLLNARATDERAVSFNYLFDIGAGLTVLFSQDFIEDSLLLKPKRRKYLKQGEGLGGKVDIYITTMKELRLGPYKFKQVPVNIFDDEYNITSYPVLGGLIGNDIFRRFNCILNYNKRQIHLTPNTHYRDPFDYAYSGIEIYLINGKMLVGEIPKDSPAEKAGFKVGDEVIAVDKNFGLSLNTLKEALQSNIGEISVIIKRNEELMTKKLKVISILRGK